MLSDIIWVKYFQTIFNTNYYPDNTHQWVGSTVLLVSRSLTGLDLTKQENMLLCVVCTETTESKPVKLEIRHTVIVLSMVALGI